MGLKKLDLIELCLNSAAKAFKGDWIILIDKPTIELTKLVRKIVPSAKIEILRYENWNDGNTGSFHRQLDIASEIDGNVYFLEDDHYLLPNAGEEIEKALARYDFVTHYLHPDYLTSPVHKYKKNIEIIDNQVWMECSSTVLSFGTHGKIIRDNIDMMKPYGWADQPMFEELTKRYTLMTPIPTLGTHMEVEWLSPYDWRFNA